MKIALIGYGKMGKIIERIARERGHEIVSIIDVTNFDDIKGEAFASADVAIEFSVPSAALENYRAAWHAGVPVVSGTTGWSDQMPAVKEEVMSKCSTLFWSSNFSIGVNLFFKLNRQLAKMMNHFAEYSVSMTEVHHIHKLDAPSGTAITLAEGVLSEIDRKDKWVLGHSEVANELPIDALREGEVPGRHIIRYESAVDTIEIMHDAKSREGFALGAVIAAEFTAGKRGWLTMDMLMDSIDRA